MPFHEVMIYHTLQSCSPAVVELLPAVGRAVVSTSLSEDNRCLISISPKPTLTLNLNPSVISSTLDYGSYNSGIELPPPDSLVGHSSLDHNIIHTLNVDTLK